MENPTPVPHEVDPAAALALAQMIDATEPSTPRPPMIADGLLSSLTHLQGWAIGAIGHVDSPPSFGLYVACQPNRRCPECSGSCATESLPAEVHRATGEHVILLNAGGSFSDPLWIRAEVLVKDKPGLSGVAIPQIDEQGRTAFAFPTVDLLLRVDGADITACKLNTPAGIISLRALMFREQLIHVRRDILLRAARRHASSRMA